MDNISFVPKSIPSPPDAAATGPKKIQNWTRHIAPALDSIKTLFLRCILKIFHDADPFSKMQTAMRTQEHLTKSGSLFLSQGIAFQRFLEEYNEKIPNEKSANFKTLLSDLKGAGTGSQFYRTATRANADRRAETMQKQVRALKPGESTWIDATTSVGHHGMMMRIKRDDDTKCTLYWSNTGAGIRENEEFHPSRQSESGKTICQTTAVISDVPYEVLTDGNFFNQLSNASLGFAPSKDSEKNQSEKNQPNIHEDLSVIQNMYDVLKTLTTDHHATIKDMSDLTQPENEKYWGRPQLGISCVPSSMWAMAKTILTKQELFELKTDMRMQALLKNYRKIENGSDESSTRKILVLDLVQKLKGVYKKKGLELPKEVADIANNMGSHAIDPEMQIRAARFNLKPNKACKLNPVEVSFTKKPESLTASASFTHIKTGVQYSVTDKGDGLKGDTLSDEIYLFYLGIATGNGLETSTRLPALVDKMVQIKELIAKKDSLSTELKTQEVDEELRDIETKLSAITGTAKSPEIAAQTGALLLDLAHKLTRLDRTRAGIAKQQVLIEMALWFISNEHKTDASKIDTSLMNGPEKEKLDKLQWLLNMVQEVHTALNVDFYLSEDNIWLQAHKKLKPTTT